MRQHLKTVAKHTFRLIIATFAVIGMVLTGGYFAIKFGLTNTKGKIDDRFIVDKARTLGSSVTPGVKGAPTPGVTLNDAWRTSEEWLVLKDATIKDKLLINQVASLVGISPRLLAAQMIVEQLRLFTSEREVYKQVFAPLKILGNQSQFSWGVVGIKEDTAKQVEANLKDPASPFYPGARFEHFLDYPSTSSGQAPLDINAERFNRIANTDNGHDHYYAYLYAALFLKEIEAQWQKAGWPIDNRPEILSTLYNIGFTHSKPNAAPQAGGAEIEVSRQKYTFGGLAYEFYWSDELLNEFSR